MTQQPTAGIDIGKHALDVCVCDAPIRRFDNTGDSITSLLKWLRRHTVTRVVCKASGGYERRLLERLQAVPIAVGLLHPPRLRAYARAVVRRALYMGALSAVRHNRPMRDYYHGLRYRGKPAKVALVAVMRKLLLQLNAIARRGTPWIENYARTC